MAKGIKTGGRTKGTKNKDKAALELKAIALGIDPFEILLYFAAGDWEKLGYKSGEREIVTKSGSVLVDVISPETRMNAAAEACQYVYPKRKAIEHTAPAESPLLKRTIKIAWADQDADPRIDADDEAENSAPDSDQ